MIHVGDRREILRTLAAGSVQGCVNQCLTKRQTREGQGASMSAPHAGELLRHARGAAQRVQEVRNPVVPIRR